MRPTYLEVNLEQLRKNLAAIRSHVHGAKVMPMVKANAYGHGIEGVAPFIEPFVDALGVALVEEAVQLRKMGIQKPILVAGPALVEDLPLFFEHDLILAVSSPTLLLAAEQWADSTRTRLRVHLKIDTGMERMGMREYEAEDFILQAESCRHLVLEGIYTHLANSETLEMTGAMLPPRTQLERFQAVLHVYEKHSLPLPVRHVCNSGGILNLPEAHFDMVRPGVLFYGVYPGRDIQTKIEVSPAMTWKSRVAYSKITLPQRSVSYGSLWQAEVESRIATIPCGYADGYFRRMTNQGRVLINQKSYPQVGRICMDQFMVNAGRDNVAIGDEVILLGGGILPQELADWAGTNEYEVMTNISARVPRVFVK